MRFLWLLALLATAPAQADLYRWVDPQTGAVKFSSYPPPWYGDPALEARSPKVQHIPAGREAPPIKPAAGLDEKPAAPAAPAAPATASNAPTAGQGAAPSTVPSPALVEAQRKAITETIERALKESQKK